MGMARRCGVLKAGCVLCLLAANVAVRPAFAADVGLTVTHGTGGYLETSLAAGARMAKDVFLELGYDRSESSASAASRTFSARLDAFGGEHFRAGFGFAAAPESDGYKYLALDVGCAYYGGRNALAVAAMLDIRSAQHSQLSATVGTWSDLSQLSVAPALRLTLHDRLSCNLRSEFFSYGDGDPQPAVSVQGRRKKEPLISSVGTTVPLDGYPSAQFGFGLSWRFLDRLLVYGDWSRTSFASSSLRENSALYGLSCGISSSWEIDVSRETVGPSTYYSAGFRYSW